jgi:hypothetical protein
MGIEDKIEQGFIERLIQSLPSLPDYWPDNNPSRWVKFKRIMPPKQKFMERLADMQAFFTEITGYEPKKVIMGWKQQREMQHELRSLHMIMMPYKGYVGRLIGMDVIFIQEDNRLEVTC